MKISLALLSFSLLIGCATPTSVKIAGDSKVTVHNLDKVTLPKAEVLDQNGAVMADQTVTWEVTPPEVAALAGDAVEPKADGTATVTAKSGTLSASMTLEVSLPDAVVIGGIAPEGAILGIGQTATLTGSVTADGAAVDGQTVEFSSSDANVAKVEGTTLTGIAAGTATITAKSGDLNSSVTVTVGTAPATADAAAAEPAAK